MDDKLQALRDRLESRKEEDDDWLRKLKQKIAEEESQREAEILRSSQEVELKQEQIRLQKLALEAARDAARIKKEQDEAEEAEKLRKY